MVYGNIKDVLRYQGIHPELDIALKYVNDEFLSTLGSERVSIKDDDVYVFKVDLQTKPDAETFFENHHDYIDIHVVLDGAERMDIEIPERLNMYEEHPETDAYFFHGDGGQSVILTPGKFLIAFPEDAHRTCGMLETPQKFVKAVYKIRL